VRDSTCKGHVTEERTVVLAESRSQGEVGKMGRSQVMLSFRVLGKKFGLYSKSKVKSLGGGRGVKQERTS
jgi:hypothetical protein